MREKERVEGRSKRGCGSKRVRERAKREFCFVREIILFYLQLFVVSF